MTVRYSKPTVRYTKPTVRYKSQNSREFSLIFEKVRAVGLSLNNLLANLKYVTIILSLIIGISVSLVISSPLIGQGQITLASEDFTMVTNYLETQAETIKKYSISDTDYEGPHQMLDIFYLSKQSEIRIELISDGLPTEGTYQIVNTNAELIEEKEISILSGKTIITKDISNYSVGEYSLLVIAPKFSLVRRFRVSIAH